MLSYRSLSVLSFMGASLAAQAQRPATVLPKNIYRVRLVGIVAAPLMQTLNSQGEGQSLMADMERTLTTKDIAAKDPNLNALYAGLNQLEEGLGDSLMSVDLMPKAHMSARQTVLAVEYGLTSRLSLGIIVPTVQMRVTSSFDARVNTQTAKLAARAAGAPPLEAGLQQFASNTPTAQTFAQSLFTANGYQVPRDFSYAGLGDIEIGAKYQYLKSEALRGTLLAGFRAPTTSHRADRSNILDRDTGDGQWDLALEASNEWDALKTLTFGVASRYTLQLPDSREQALLKDGQIGLPNLNDSTSIHRVRRDLGDMIDGELSARVNIGSAWHTSGVWGVAYKLENRYSGPQGYQVSKLGANTESAESRLELGVGYSTIPDFAAKKFPVPMEVKLAYNTITAGMNTPRSAYSRMDFIVYF